MMKSEIIENADLPLLCILKVFRQSPVRKEFRGN